MGNQELKQPLEYGQSVQSYAMEYSGNVVEMGDLEESESGFLVEIRPQVFIKICGFARHDIMAMPNILYKKVKITIETVDRVE